MIFRGYCFTGMYYKSMTIVVIERCLAVMDDGTRSEEPTMEKSVRESVRKTFTAETFLRTTGGSLRDMSSSRKPEFTPTSTSLSPSGDIYADTASPPRSSAPSHAMRT